MTILEGLRNRVLAPGNSDDVDVIGHQAVSGNFQFEAASVELQQFAIAAMIGFVEKHIEATDSALGDMVRKSW